MTVDVNFHILDVDTLDADMALPRRMNCPFYYQPHPLAVAAAEEVQKKIRSMVEWGTEPEQGKMFGVLVVEDKGSETRGSESRFGYLMAYSGQIAGREDWPGWVPAVFDYLQPDGYFVTHENEISLINKHMDELLTSPRYAVACARLQRVKDEGQNRIDDYRHIMAESKARRNELRTNNADTEQLIKESQFQKAELRRVKAAVAAEVAEAQMAVDFFADRIAELRCKRKEMSDALQQWLFEQFVFLNAKGEKRNLVEIFGNVSLSKRIGTLNAIPSGAGECCAPKLLQYAYKNGYTPVTMAEFWWGKSPVGEIREQLHYYPACQGKCKPILDFMLQGLDVEPNPLLEEHAPVHLIILYRDEHLVVIDKPTGMLSAPGKGKVLSAIELLMLQHPELGQLYSVHRLDMQTSGLLVFARTEEMQRTMQKMFAMREVHKTYVAVLERNIDIPAKGTISLPLAKDYINRPRMKVDPNGLPSVTDYEVINSPDAQHTRLHLFPHTGRTHQLRVHCASQDGLGCPIIGDDLYGAHAQRLLLHAEHLSFVHPVTGKQMELHSDCTF